MDDNPKILYLLDRYSQLQSARGYWEDHWESIRSVVRPSTGSFSQSGSNTTRGNRMHQQIYDSTAPWALDQFSAGLNSFLTSPTEPWFDLVVMGADTADLDDEARNFLHLVREQFFFEFSLPDTNLQPSLHEVYQDIGAFGTAVLYEQEMPGNKMLRYRSYPLASCFTDENYQGEIDTLYFRRSLSGKQLLREFSETMDTETYEKVKVGGESAEHEVIHAVFPRKDTEFSEDPVPFAKRPFVSVYFSPKLRVVLKESGYDHFPYHVPRWSKLCGETYGRSPAMSALPDIMMINQMSKEVLYSAELANSPPMLFEEDSILLPVDGDASGKLRITPKSLLFKAQGAADPQPLISGSQPQLTLEMMEQRRERIIQAFYVDFLLRAKKKERQTITEILDDRAEMLRQMAPHLGRIESELLSGLIRNRFRNMQLRGVIPDVPESLSQAQLDVTYTSPAAKAQMGTRAQELSGFLQELTQLASVWPDLVGVIDPSALGREMVHLRSVQPNILKTPEQMKQEQDQQAIQQQQQQIMEGAPAAAGALKDIATARSTDPTLVNELGL